MGAPRAIVRTIAVLASPRIVRGAQGGGGGREGLHEWREAPIERERARKSREGESKIEREKQKDIERDRERVVCVCLSEIVFVLLAKALYCFIAGVLRGFTHSKLGRPLQMNSRGSASEKCEENRAHHRLYSLSRHLRACFGWTQPEGI